MLISQSLIFIHYPKTGGSSVQAYLQKAVRGRFFPHDDANLSRPQKESLMHEGLQVAYQYANRLGLNPFEIPAITCIRNPYDLMLSGYLFLKQKHGHKIADLESNFLDYMKNLFARTPVPVMQGRASAIYGPYTAYLTIGQQKPDNLTIARTENLQEDVSAFLKDKVGITPKMPMPHKNRTRHAHFSKYFGEEEERLVYDMWKNVFDNGLYARYEGLESAATR